MNKIQIFQKEIEDGISDQVQSTASVAYLSPFTVKAEEFTSEVEKSEIEKLLADENKQHDLYYLESVLVSTNWNRNDDVFLADVTWAARNTPEDKPFNFMHDENDIIGHIIGSYVTDTEGNRISDDQEETPANFDIISYWSSWGISLSVTISNGFLQLFSLDKNFFSYSLVVEQLKTEGWQYFQLSGKYENAQNHGQAFK